MNEEFKDIDIDLYVKAIQILTDKELKEEYIRRLELFFNLPGSIGNRQWEYVDKVQDELILRRNIENDVDVV